jgi:hypothetical protein
MHSQETNIMINSKEVIAEMMASTCLRASPGFDQVLIVLSKALYSNQNTHLYGLVGTDGIWRDAEGKDMNHYDNLKKGRHQGLAGIMQFIKTI